MKLKPVADKEKSIIPSGSDLKPWNLLCTLFHVKDYKICKSRKQKMIAF